MLGADWREGPALGTWARGQSSVYETCVLLKSPTPWLESEEIQKMDRSNIQRNNGQGFSNTEEKSLSAD